MRCLRPEIRASHASTQSEGQTQGRTRLATTTSVLPAGSLEAG